MAAIDKLYVHSYYEYEDLKKWSLAYYPELLFYFYDINTTYKDWEAGCKAYVKEHLNIAKRDYEKLGDFKDLSEAIRNLKKYYKDTAVYDCPDDQAFYEVNSAIVDYNRNSDDWEGLYSRPVMNTPLDVDRKLKWICPVPCVRKYLHEQCGVNPKWEWLYKIFWKGKKHFYI